MTGLICGSFLCFFVFVKQKQFVSSLVFENFMFVILSGALGFERTRTEVNSWNWGIFTYRNTLPIYQKKHTSYKVKGISGIAFVSSRNILKLEVKEKRIRMLRNWECASMMCLQVTIEFDIWLGAVVQSEYQSYVYVYLNGHLRSCFLIPRINVWGCDQASNS